MARPFSLREFSREAGVSPSTVSRVFANPELVGFETRERVMRLARRYGFRPNLAARAANGRATQSIGVMLADMRVSFFADIAMGLQRPLLERNYLPVILSKTCGMSDMVCLRRLVDHRVDAMIVGIGDESISEDDLSALVAPGFPLVLVDSSERGFKHDSVSNDDFGGGYQAGRHLLELGHRSFGFIHYGEGQSTCDGRQRGFEKALSEAGLRLPPERVIMNETQGSPDALKSRNLEQLREFLRRPDRPSAIFAPSDNTAMEIYDVAAELGLRIPRDLSVVGFADLNFAKYMNPSLTTVRQDGMEMGLQAAELALQRLKEPEREFQVRVIPTRLLVRDSTAGPGN